MINDGGVGASLIEHICRLQRSSLPLPMCIVTIPYLNRINHLFQNGRALLKCQIFIPPTEGSFSNVGGVFCLERDAAR